MLPGCYDRCMRRSLLLLLTTLCHACSPMGGFHGAGVPVTWSLGITGSPQGRTSLVCQMNETRPCVLQRSTEARPNYASFALHVFGPPATTFRGSMLVTYLNDPNPSHYRSDVALTSQGKAVHHSLFSKVTTAPGEYSARIFLEESRDDLPQPRVHELTVPVIVQ
jgi:hypothetical protein